MDAAGQARLGLLKGRLLRYLFFDHLGTSPFHKANEPDSHAEYWPVNGSGTLTFWSHQDSFMPHRHPSLELALWLPFLQQVHTLSDFFTIQVSAQVITASLSEFGIKRGSSVALPASLVVVEVALVYEVLDYNDYDINTKEALLAKYGNHLSCWPQVVETIPETFTHLTTALRDLAYVVVEFRDGTRLFVEATDMPYARFRIGYEVPDEWERLLREVDDDTGRKRYEVVYV